jgi:hypothetical protein
MFNIRDIASATYRVVLSSASSALRKDRHRMFTIPGLNQGRIVGRERGVERVLADPKGELNMSTYW